MSSSEILVGIRASVDDTLNVVDVQRVGVRSLQQRIDRLPADLACPAIALSDPLPGWLESVAAPARRETVFRAAALI